MKNIRFWAYTSAFLSLAISLAIVGYWICSVHELKVVNLNTFVGVTVALLGLIVTLAIAWQIYNAVDMKNKVEELKQLEGRIKEQEKSLEKFKYQTNDSIFTLIVRYTQDNGDYINCFWFLLKDLDALLHIEDLEIEQIDLVLDWMKDINNRIKEIDLKDEKSLKELDEAIRVIPNFKYIKSKYEPIFNDLISKVKRDKNK